MMIILLNGILGFVQEYNAEKAIDTQHGMLKPTARVLRDGKEQLVEAKTIIPGDIVIVEIGDRVPADLHLIETSNLKVEESPLTGESAPVEEPILDFYGVMMILFLGSYIGLATLWLYHHYLASGVENALMLAQTVAFTGIIILEKVNVFNFRSLSSPIALTTGWFSNRWLLLAVAVTVSLQVAAVYLPFLQKILHTTALGWHEWGVIAAAALPLFIVVEIYKYIRYRNRRHA